MGNHRENSQGIHKAAEGELSSTCRTDHHLLLRCLVVPSTSNTQFAGHIKVQGVMISLLCSTVLKISTMSVKILTQ